MAGLQGFGLGCCGGGSDVAVVPRSGPPMSRVSSLVGQVVGVLGQRGVMAAAALLVLAMEGISYVAYQDTGGVWTICAGHTAGVKPGDVATEQECGKHAEADLRTARQDVDRLVKVDPSLACRVALIDFTYNVGAGAFSRSTLLRKINAGDQSGAAAEFKRWVYVAGKDCRIAANDCGGIVFRREVEAALCRL